MHILANLLGRRSISTECVQFTVVLILANLHDKTAQVMKVLRNADTHRVGGMLPTGWNLATGQPTDCDWILVLYLGVVS